eukprot:scaffold1060_cov246-Pinguiococcus_pyrenoidosus.AAC.3
MVLLAHGVDWMGVEIPLGLLLRALQSGGHVFYMDDTSRIGALLNVNQEEGGGNCKKNAFSFWWMISPEN